MNSKYSSWTEILSGVPQGSIVGPLIFNIYLSDLFLFLGKSNIANNADDNTAYACKKDVDAVREKLEEDSCNLIQWASNNLMAANPDKFHLILSETDTSLSVNIGKHEIFNQNSVKLLGVTIDNKLTLNKHVSSLCKKASQKLHALARVARYMNTAQRRTIMKAFVNSQFGYCPLLWMMHSRSLNNRINKIHERALRLVYNDQLSSFKDLLELDGCVTIHERNLQTLATEVYKVISRIAPTIMNEIFQLKDNIKYNSRFPLKTHNVNTVHNGTETLTFLGPRIWAIVPTELKTISTLREFKTKIKLWKPDKCPCRLCKVYVAGVGFVDIQ